MGFYSAFKGLRDHHMHFANYKNYSFLNLGSVSPCIIIYSNKSTNQIHQSRSFIACRLNTAQHVSGIHMPVIRSSTAAVAASGLPSERGGGSVVGRGRSGLRHYTDHTERNTTAR
jgi:hypothetical protein